MFAGLIPGEQPADRPVARGLLEAQYQRRPRGGRRTALRFGRNVARAVGYVLMNGAGSVAAAHTERKVP